MSHKSGHIIVQSLLVIFDPAEYEGVRGHFNQHELSRIDEMRAKPEDHAFGNGDKFFASRMLAKAIATAAA